MNYFINTILSGLWSVWTWFSLKARIAIILLVISVGLISSAVLYHFNSINKLQTAIESQKEGIAIKDQREIDQAKEAVNNSAIESNKTIQTDSNKFSKDNKHLTNKFCDYYCRQGVLDSTCAEWAKENGRSCS